MINLNASVIVFYRKDSKDRERNLQILIDYYQSNFENFEFIVVEQFKEHSNIDFDSYSIQTIPLTSLQESLDSYRRW